VDGVGSISYAFSDPRPWLILELLAALASLWLSLDSIRRHLPAFPWRWSSYLLVLATVPLLIFPMLGVELQGRLTPLTEPLTYLGLLGALLPPWLLVVYSLNFRGRIGCARGHVYAKSMGTCPSCHPLSSESIMASTSPILMAAKRALSTGPRDARSKTQAWLIATDGSSFQLNREVTTVGKSSKNDIQITTDNTVSRVHLRIQEKNGAYILHDLGSTNGTRLNGRRVAEPVPLEEDDVIELGDNTRLTFIRDVDAIWRRTLELE
jgi:hypothetical protein